MCIVLNKKDEKIKYYIQGVLSVQGGRESEEAFNKVQPTIADTTDDSVPTIVEHLP